MILSGRLSNRICKEPSEPILRASVSRFKSAKVGTHLAHKSGRDEKSGDRKLLIRLEAAIGIEPMNKGFAETDYVFAQVPTYSLVPILIGVSDVSCLRMISQMRACCDW